MSHILEKATGDHDVQVDGVHSIDPRVRVIVMVAFAVVVVSLNEFAVLGVALVLALLIAVSFHLPLVRTAKRVATMDAFIVFMLFMLPFTVPGEEMFRLGDLVASWEGFWQALEIAIKANAIVLALLALVGSMEATTLGHALRRLWVPEKLVQLLFFTVRYIEVLGQEYQRLRLAMKARAFRQRNSLHTWRSVGYLLGMLLVRSLERSERILGAMKCRGYTGRLYALDTLSLRQADIVFAGASAAAFVILLWMQYA